MTPTPAQLPEPAVPPGSVSADTILGVVRWYALTAPGAPGYQKQQEPRR